MLRANGGPLRGRWTGDAAMLDRAVRTLRYEVREPVPGLLGPVRGTVVLNAAPRSLAMRAWRYLLAVAIRESGL